MRPFFFSLLCAIPTVSLSHEFWIAPLTYQVDPNSKIEAHFRIGQDFKGVTYSWTSHRTTQTLTVQSGAVADYDGTLGDRPAMSLTPAQDGLVVLAHETRDDRLTYQDWAKFVNFVEHKNFEGALDRHAARGLPETGFVETYRRYAKSLVAVGTGAGQDQRLGFDVEIVALANPYTQTTGSMPVQVWYQDAPVVGGQVEVYARDADAAVQVMLYATDENGMAQIPIQPGHDYMVDHVVLEERDGSDASGAVWHSMWANLTFSVPASGG